MLAASVWRCLKILKDSRLVVVSVFSFWAEKKTHFSIRKDLQSKEKTSIRFQLPTEE